MGFVRKSTQPDESRYVPAKNPNFTTTFIVVVTTVTVTEMTSIPFYENWSTLSLGHQTFNCIVQSIIISIIFVALTNILAPSLNLKMLVIVVIIMIIITIIVRWF